MKFIDVMPYRIKNTLVSHSFILPLIFVFFVFNLFPLVNSFYVSFFLDYYTEARFVGFDNYRNLENEVKGLGYALLNILIFLPICVVVIQIIALFSAKLITRTPKIIQNSAIIILFLPFMLPESTISSIFANMFFSETGLLANMIIWINDHAFTREIMTVFGEGTVDKVDFLNRNRSDSPVVFIYTYILFCWVIKYCGFFCLIYYISLQSIKNDIVEAAMLEGASVKDVFYKIEIPMIKSMIGMMAILSLIFLLSKSTLLVSMSRSVLPDQERYMFSVHGLLYDLWANVSMLGATTWVYVLFLVAMFLIGFILFKLIRYLLK
ncbi:MAG: sugar ABC transporter permease [Saccharospirillaceae bacterium]|nr:sugar ABC transporter permease [Pseudomonadales bacterium]NRB78735.1 sugar ABC transporter permease [Saccharospirillaceae bacterium]